jgi:hypothetical protein
MATKKVKKKSKGKRGGSGITNYLKNVKKG